MTKLWHLISLFVLFNSDMALSMNAQNSDDSVEDDDEEEDESDEGNSVREYRIECNEGDTVFDLKELLSLQLNGYPQPGQQNIIFSEKSLPNSASIKRGKHGKLVAVITPGGKKKK